MTISFFLGRIAITEYGKSVLRKCDIMKRVEMMSRIQLNTWHAYSSFCCSRFFIIKTYMYISAMYIHVL